MWGYIIQQFSQTVYILGAGFVLAAIVSKCGHLLAGEKHRLLVFENVLPRKAQYAPECIVHTNSEKIH